MSKLDVRIVSLPAMRVACFNGYGEGPEGIALGKALGWATPGETRRFFGYNNPNPAPGSPNYGYDVWVTADDGVEIPAEARKINFPGGLYAVVECKVEKPWEDIPGTWQALSQWRENSKYQHATHQWLEEHVDPANAQGGDHFTLNLYLPIKE